MLVDPKVYRRVWRSVHRTYARRIPSKRNARWLIRRIEIESAASADGPYAVEWLPVPGVTPQQWDEFRRAADW